MSSSPTRTGSDPTSGWGRQHTLHMKSDLIHIYDQFLTTLEKTIDVMKYENRLKKLRNEVKEWLKRNKPLSTSSSDLLSLLNLFFRFRPTIDCPEEGTDWLRRNGRKSVIGQLWKREDSNEVNVSQQKIKEQLTDSEQQSTAKNRLVITSESSDTLTAPTDENIV